MCEKIKSPILVLGWLIFLTTTTFATAKDLTYENQLKLSWLGYYNKALDGISGPATLSAFTNFYADRKLSNKNIDPQISHKALNKAFNREVDGAKWLIKDSFEKIYEIGRERFTFFLVHIYHFSFQNFLIGTFHI